jgi:hypothetical protein
VYVGLKKYLSQIQINMILKILTSSRKNTFMDSKNIHDFGKSSGVQNIAFTDSNKIKSTFTDSEK